MYKIVVEKHKELTDETFESVITACTTEEEAIALIFKIKSIAKNPQDVSYRKI